MRINWAKFAFVAAMASMVIAPLSGAMAQATESVRVDLNLKDADMLEATNMLFLRTGISFVVEPSSEPYKKITLKLDNVTPEEAVRYICQSSGAYFRRDENGVYVITQRKPEAAPVVVPTAAKQPRSVRKIKLVKAGAQDVYESVMFGIPFDSRRGFADLKRFEQAMHANPNQIFGPQVNVATAQGPSQLFNPVNAPRTANTANIAGANNGSDILLPGDESSKQMGGMGGMMGGMGGMGGGMMGGGMGMGGQGMGGGMGMGGQGMGGGMGMGMGMGGGQLIGGQGLVGDSIDFISFDPTDNSLVVRGDEDDINQLQTYIQLFDIAPRQVQIKVEFITTTDQLQRTFGTEFLYTRGTINAGTRPGTFVDATAPVFLNYATGNVTARLRTALAEGQGKVVSAPIVRTLNNQPATITSSVTTTIFINQTTVTQGAVVSFSNPFPLTALTSLSVAPRINLDNTITVFLAPSIGNFVGFSQGPDGQQIPNQVFQSIAVVARVKNNETIVLGGLNTKNEEVRLNRVPVLSELPIIGQFFRLTNRSRSNSELLIFVTPTILDEDDSTGIGGPF